eukprot:3568255-Rhodomonas_salina.1
MSDLERQDHGQARTPSKEANQRSSCCDRHRHRTSLSAFKRQRKHHDWPQPRQCEHDDTRQQRLSNRGRAASSTSAETWEIRVPDGVVGGRLPLGPSVQDPRQARGSPLMPSFPVIPPHRVPSHRGPDSHSPAVRMLGPGRGEREKRVRWT